METLLPSKKSDEQKGSNDSFPDLYDAYIQKIYNYIYYKTHHKETAEDLASKTFLKAFEKFHTYDKKKGTFSSWIYRIARNVVIDHYRTKKETSPLDIWDAYEDPHFIHDIDTKKQLQEVQMYVSQLQQTQREIIIMRVWDELSYKEIATILKITEASCKMTFSRAIRQLRTIMPLQIWLTFILKTLV